jgi:hypothetical protein
VFEKEKALKIIFPLSSIIEIEVSVNISSQNLSDNSEWQARHIDI